ARIHQHNEIGNGEIDRDSAFAYLREREYDGPVSVCVFGWEEEAAAINVRMRERIEKELGGRRAAPPRAPDPPAGRPQRTAHGRRRPNHGGAPACERSASAW